MSEDRENKSVTAKDLLSRLGQKKSTSEEKRTEVPTASSFAEFMAKKEQDKFPAEEQVIEAETTEETNDQTEDAESLIYDEMSDGAEQSEQQTEEYVSDDEDAEYAFDDEYETYEEADIPELTYEEEAELDMAAGMEADPGDYDDDGEYINEYDDFEDEDDDYFADDSEEDQRYDPVNEEDIIPDDEFFDDDPLDDEMFSEADEESETENAFPAEPTQEDREEEFKSLVEEVTGDTSDDSELNDDDIGLMVALGMEDELARTVGEETASQLAEDYIADQEEWVDRTNRFGVGEYSDPSENGEIAEMYGKRNKMAVIKLICCAVFAGILFVFENLPVFGYQLSGALDPEVYPVVYTMIDLQIVLLSAAMVWNSVKTGFTSLVKFKPTVESMTFISAAVAVIASAVAAYSSVPGKAPVLFNFPVSLLLLFAAVNEYMTVRREIFSFNIISSKKPKFVMRNLSTRDSMLETEAVADMALDSAVADEGDIIKIQKTDFVDGYFWHTKNKGGANNGFVGLTILISAVLAVIIAIFAGVGHKDVSAITAGYAALVAALPASMLLMGAYPFYRANRHAYENDSTIIGEGSVEEYSGVGVISFDDVNVFPASGVKVRNVRLFNNSRIDKVLYYASSVFSATGGPLADVFEVATMETGHSKNVKILETGTGYIEATVNGKNILFGRADALSRVGIIIPENVISDEDEIPADCSVMYMIYQRKLVSKMVVNYVVDPDFEYILKQLTGSGMCVCVKTFDPNIDEEMIYRQMRSAGRYSMRVIKYKSTEEITKYAKRAEGGIVSRGNTKSLLRTVASCDRILSAQKTGYIIGTLSAIFGAAIVGIMLIAGSFASLYSLYIVLCQILWLVPAVITTKMIVK